MGGMAFDTSPSNDARLNKEIEELGLLEGYSDIENEYEYGERLPIFRSHSPSEDEITERARMLDSVLWQPVLCIRRNSPIEDCYCVACEPGVLVAVEVLVNGLDAACVWNAWQWKCWLMAWMRRVC